LHGQLHGPSIFGTNGVVAGRIAALGWTFTIVACVVLAIILVLVIIPLFTRRARPRELPGGEITTAGNPLRWIVVGGAIVPAAVLVSLFVVALVVQAQLAPPARAPAAIIEITAHRWWWEVRYSGGAANPVVTANEIHIPVGEPVRLDLVSTNVIHSFWVPKLAGKTDVIPGQRNTMWMEADSAGAYLGECAEYCGLQHAHMNMIVVAESRADYDRWLDEQSRNAAPVTSAGASTFLTVGCSGCHAVRGTNATGTSGPDLTHLASRRQIAGGALANTEGNLGGWIANAQAIKPGSEMPTMPLTGRQIGSLLAYLESLK
jgi:cytochrome c oxidase subunit 2